MVSDFRRKKLLYVFNVFFDIDKSGSLTKNDFLEAVDRIAKNKGFARDDPRIKQAEQGLLRVWDLLKTQADTDNDDEVSQDEWVAMWDNYISKAETPEWQTQYSKNIFNLVDSGGDGVIDEAEYTKHYSVYGMSKEDCAKAFRKASSGKDTICFEEYQELWTQYFVSEDPAAPGNFIFGTQ